MLELFIAIFLIEIGIAIYLLFPLKDIFEKILSKVKKCIIFNSKKKEYKSIS